VALIQRFEEIWRMSENSWLSTTVDRNINNYRNKTLIICHGLTGDKIGPQKLLSDLSGYLALSCGGAEVVRFDFRGSGLSSGTFVDTSLDSMCEDALWIANRFSSPVIWVGLSTGALIALMAAGKRGKKEQVIAVSNGFADQIDFNNLEGNLVPLRGGQLFLSKDYFVTRSRLCPRANYFHKTGAITSILGSNDEKHFREYHSLQDAGVKAHIIDGGDHLFTDLGKRKELFSYLKDLINETV